MKRTTGQNKRLYQLLTNKGIDSDTKAILVNQVSNGRTEKSSELNTDECNWLISILEGDNKVLEATQKERTNRLRRTIISVIYNLPVEFGFYSQIGQQKHFFNDKFDEFMLHHKHSPFPGRKFNELKMNELNRLLAVLNNWVEFYKKKKK